MQIVVAVRYQVFASLLLASVAYWTLVPWLGAPRTQAAPGHDPLTQALLEAEAWQRATEIWVVGGLLLHGLVAFSAWRRAKREVAVGVSLSLGVHLLFSWLSGVIG